MVDDENIRKYVRDSHEYLEVEYKGNVVQIDKKIYPLIKKLWDIGVVTQQCCQGGDEVEETRKWSYKKNGKSYEKAHIMFHREGMSKIQKILPENSEYIVGVKLTKKVTEYNIRYMDSRYGFRFFLGASKSNWVTFNLDDVLL